MARYRGRHRAPTTTGRTLARTAIAGAVIGTPLAVAPAAHAESGGTVWDRLAQCESSGNWSINTGNGYYGGVQFSSSTWLGYGGGAYAATANLASESQQIVIANKVLAGQGWGAWPVCSVKEGLTGEPTTGGPTGGGSGSNGGSKARAHKSHKKAAVMKLPTTHPVLSKKMYTVRRGDTLTLVARRYGVSVAALKSANGLSGEDPTIQAGRRLKIPAS